MPFMVLAWAARVLEVGAHRRRDADKDGTALSENKMTAAACIRLSRPLVSHHPIADSNFRSYKHNDALWTGRRGSSVV